VGFRVDCSQAGQTFHGSTSPEAGRVTIHLENVHFSGPGMSFDMMWVDEVPGLVKVVVDGVRVTSGTYGRKELWPLLVGRSVARIRGCATCGCPIDGGDGAPEVCPEGLSHRCVLSS